jgi:uncharacterized protein YcfJ
MSQAVQRAATLAAVLSSACFAQLASAAEYANVVSSTPVTASVPVSRQVCSDGQALVQSPPSGVGAVIGAVAGGVIGNTIGAGFGRAAATGVGAVTGALVGNQVEANANPPTAVPVRSCQMVTSYENRVVGYDVMYEYGGQRYNTRLARDPGRQLAINVQPAGEVGAGVPSPATAYADPSQTGQAVYYTQPPATVYQPYYATPYYAPYPAYVGPVIGVGIGFGGYRRWR